MSTSSPHRHRPESRCSRTLGDLQLRTADIKAAEAAVDGSGTAPRQRRRTSVGRRRSRADERRDRDSPRRPLVAHRDRGGCARPRLVARPRDSTNAESARASSRGRRAISRPPARLSRRSSSVLTTTGHEGVVSLAHSNIAEAALRLGRHRGRGTSPACQPRTRARPRAARDARLLIDRRGPDRGGWRKWRDAVELQAHTNVMLAASDHQMYRVGPAPRRRTLGGRQ